MLIILALILIVIIRCDVAEGKVLKEHRQMCMAHQETHVHQKDDIETVLKKEIFIRIQETDSYLELNCWTYCDDWKIVKGLTIKCYNLHFSSRKSSTLRAIDGITDINLLTFENQEVNYIPMEISKIFGQIQGLRIDNSQLKEVNKHDLCQFPKLIELILSNNEINFLPGDSFEDNTDLKLINFDYNHISSVGFDILVPLVNLKFASFLSNNCINGSYAGKIEITSLVSHLNENCTKSIIFPIVIWCLLGVIAFLAFPIYYMKHSRRLQEVFQQRPMELHSTQPPRVANVFAIERLI